MWMSTGRLESLIGLSMLMAWKVCLVYLNDIDMDFGLSMWFVFIACLEISLWLSLVSDYCLVLFGAVLALSPCSLSIRV